MSSFYKEANVCPVPKRDIYLLSLITDLYPCLMRKPKVFERLVFKYLFNHLRDNNLLSSLQSGFPSYSFIPGDSKVNQLTFLYNTFCQALDSGKEVRTVFCNISKAFDRVWHVGLLHNVRIAGVTGEILNWFKNYLADRKQLVALPGAVSTMAQMTLFSFSYYFTIPNSEFRILKSALRISEFGIVKYM